MFLSGRCYHSAGTLPRVCLAAACRANACPRSLLVRSAKVAHVESEVAELPRAVLQRVLGAHSRFQTAVDAKEGCKAREVGWLGLRSHKTVTTDRTSRFSDHLNFLKYYYNVREGRSLKLITMHTCTDDTARVSREQC